MRSRDGRRPPRRSAAADRPARTAGPAARRAARAAGRAPAAGWSATPRRAPAGPGRARRRTSGCRRWRCRPVAAGAGTPGAEAVRSTSATSDWVSGGTAARRTAAGTGRPGRPSALRDPLGRDHLRPAPSSRRATKRSTPALGSSIHWVSSRISSTGRSAASPRSSSSTARRTASWSCGVAGTALRSSAPSSAARRWAGSTGGRGASRTPSKRSTRARYGRSASASAAAARSTRVSAAPTAGADNASRTVDFPMPAGPHSSTLRPRRVPTGHAPGAHRGRRASSPRVGRHVTSLPLTARKCDRANGAFSYLARATLVVRAIRRMTADNDEISVIALDQQASPANVHPA
jgi:hypothetical protein